MLEKMIKKATFFRSGAAFWVSKWEVKGIVFRGWRFSENPAAQKAQRYAQGRAEGEGGGIPLE